MFDDDQKAELYTPGFRTAVGNRQAADFMAAAFHECEGRDGTTAATCADVFTYLPCDILTKVDVASMAYGLEVRSPFLDHPVVELASAMPIGLKRNGKGGKRILLDTFSDLLPPSIRTRRKMGFGIPLGAWFRGELRSTVHDLLLSRRSLERGIFEPAAIRRLVQEHSDSIVDHGYRLWCLMILELWMQTWADAPPVASR